MTGLTEREGAIVLPERTDMAVAGPLRDAVLASSRDLVFDARAVAHVTTPALQVLMATRDHQKTNGKSVRIDAPSAGFIASLRTLGVPLSRLETAESDR